MLPETIATERLTLRPPRLDDAPAVFERYARDPEVARYLNWKSHDSVSTVGDFLRRTIQDREDGTGFAWVVVKNADGRLMGMIDARPDGFKVSVGYCLARDEWGNGYMTEALRAVIDALFSVPEIFRVSAVCDVENAASARVMEKAGMTCEGILRRYVVHPNVSPEPRDVCCYAKVRSSLGKERRVFSLEYKGRYACFDFDAVRTYPICERANKVSFETMLHPEELLAEPEPRFRSPELDAVIETVLAARANGRRVIVFTGAHLVKNGFGLLLVDLMRRGLVTLVATNAAGLTHDLELALIGETSEIVPDALPAGRFGMCRETGEIMNRAWRAALQRGLGAGEALGMLILGELQLHGQIPFDVEFPHAELSIAAAGIRHGVPVTMHASLGTDVIDQHPSFDPEAKGGASGVDFGVFAAHVCELAGGVALNIGSSVQGPEVLLKAVSMAANVGRPPRGLVAASFDMRPVVPGDAEDERTYTYYYRDHKSVVGRIPQAFGGKGYYIQGEHLDTVPALYRGLVERADKAAGA